MSTTITSTPVAPVVGKQGSSKPGGHYEAYRATPRFALDATLKLISGTNPWRPNTPGFHFYVGVLAKGPKTVAEAIALGAKATPSVKANEVQKHLRWLFTWGGSYVEIGGKLFSAPVVASPPVAPVAAPSKGKGKKVSA